MAPTRRRISWHLASTDLTTLPLRPPRCSPTSATSPCRRCGETACELGGRAGEYEQEPDHQEPPEVLGRGCPPTSACGRRCGIIEPRGPRLFVTVRCFPRIGVRHGGRLPWP